MENKLLIISDLIPPNKKINFKWNEEISFKIMDSDNQKIITAADESSYKARIALAALLFECVLTILSEKKIYFKDADLCLEALWTGAIDKAYSKNLNNDWNYSQFEDDSVYIFEDILQVINNFLYDLYNRYKKDSIYLGDMVSKFAVLAQHIMPDKKLFSTWLSDIFRKTAKAFPRTMDIEEYYELETETYDASLEEPVYREFFEKDFIHNNENAKKSINKFLQSLNPSENPYLCTPEEMLANGFKGTPYKY